MYLACQPNPISWLIARVLPSVSIGFGYVDFGYLFKLFVCILAYLLTPMNSAIHCW